VPIGTTGLRWAHLQLTGLYGYEKNVTIQQREEWVAENLELILAVGTDPHGSAYDWWTGADKPWQFMACCRMYRDIVLKMRMCIPVEHIESRMVAAQDGSCNGIQHFSAMLLDKIGGSAVNLTRTSDIARDIYFDVAKVLIKLISYVTQDEAVMAQCILDMVVDRKTTKRQTMVVPYGGTIQSCNEYSREWIEEMHEKYKVTNQALSLRIEGIGYKDLSKFLGSNVWEALNQTIVGARKCMKFVKDMTKAVIAGEKDDPNGKRLIYHTLNNFPVLASNRKVKPHEVHTRICGEQRLVHYAEIDEINQGKIVTGAAPNFVHGVDATHMARSIVLAAEQGVKFFWCIHDSFGTHLGLSDALADSLREAFVDLHKNGKPLEALYNELKLQHDRYSFPKREFPEWEAISQYMGDLDLDEGLKSPFFFL
jgi:DNA-directed RNA polymerase